MKLAFYIINKGSLLNPPELHNKKLINSHKQPRQTPYPHNTSPSHALQVKGLPRILKMKKSATFSMTDEAIAKEVMAIIQEYNYIDNLLDVINFTLVNIPIDAVMLVNKVISINVF